jgi:DNA-directed RNA polymerase subunit F
MNYKILEDEYVTKAEVKKILAERKDLELEQKLTKEHTANYKKMRINKALKLKDELKNLNIPKLKDELIIKIVDILPESLDELKVILQMSLIPFNDDEIEKVFELLKNNL